jgi:uncharacterized protein (DUF1501 family)
MIRGAWRETVLVLLIEFGRTARINGTDGTDHGTGTVMPLAGGGARMRPHDRRLAWAKLGGLVQEAHLKRTIDVRGVVKVLVKDHLRADDRAFAANVFPGSDDAKPMAGLVA